jgi:hypothetical protein
VEHSASGGRGNVLRSDVVVLSSGVLPYTFFFLIKAPPYAWMPWFARHQAARYWIAAASAVMANWRPLAAWRQRDRRFLAGVGLWGVAGIYLSWHPFLRILEDNRAAY